MERIRNWIAQRAGSSANGKRSKSHGVGEPSIALIHFADRFTAAVGETISYTAWILNDSREYLTGVSLIRRSFTNANLENLAYDNAPEGPGTIADSLAPGESTELHLSYVVREEDVVHGGEIVSAMQVKASSASGSVWDECDAIVHLSPGHVGGMYSLGTSRLDAS